MMQDQQHPSSKTVLLTGATGNLGWKLLHHLVSLPGYARFVGLDLRQPDPDRLAALQQVAQAAGQQPELQFITCDLADPHDQAWREAITQADVIVHFAAQNPYPEASWGDSAASLDMTLQLALAAAASQRCQRFVFATSNHVMGRYKDSPRAEQVAS